MQDDSYRLAEEEGAHRIPTRCTNAGEGLWRQDDADVDSRNRSNATTPNGNEKNWSRFLTRKLAHAFPVALVCLLLAKASHRPRWPAPKTWKSCHEVNDDGDYYNNGNWGNWESFLQQSPCSRGSQKDALCFAQFNGPEFYVWCGGHYYERQYGDWIPGYPSIWADTHDCDELGVEGWEDVCVANGVAEEDLEGASCAMDESQRFLECGNDAEFGYVDGEYVNYDT